MTAPLTRLLAAVSAPAAEPDADLLARFVAARDDAAFAELVRRHGPAVYHTCRRLVGPSAADDAFQATFLVLAARAGSVRKAASVGSWLVGVAGRVGRRMGQRDRKRGTGDGRQETGNGGQEDTDSECPLSPVSCPPSTVSRLPSPVSCLLSSELSALLADELTRLPDRLRAAAVACLVDGRTQEQAAAALGWSARTVRRRLDEAKGLLRARLERRGVTPAAAVAAVAAAGEAAAVPAGLARRAADGATLFLAGGGANVPAAALAHGVIGTMRTLPAPAAVAACAVVLAGLGLGWANDAPPPADAPVPKAAAPAKGAPERIPPPAAPAVHTHKTANFVVEAPTAALARAMAEGSEQNRRDVAMTWLGSELPVWPRPMVVRLDPDPASARYCKITVGFGRAPGLLHHDRVYRHVDSFVTRELPRLVAHTVLIRGGHVRRPPWWFAGAIDALSGPPDAQVLAVGEARRALVAGRAYRLKALLASEVRPEADRWCEQQAVSVARFLLTREPDRRVAVLEGGGIGRLDRPAPLGAVQSAGKHGLYLFVVIGSRGDWGTVEGWDKAAKEVYGFDSLDALERAWIDWLRDESAAPPADPDRIPPPAALFPAPPGVGAATHLTFNFAVSAPTFAVATKVADAAERHRRELAKLWLGKELPDATEPMPVTVKITAGGAGGATTFAFGAADGKRPPGVKTAAMELHGPLNQLLASNLPHEVMHVVLATHFGRPLPRWADEGIAVLAESEEEQHNHDVRARELLNAGRGIRLSVLFRMTEYPRDVIVLFAQGHSVCRFLLDRGPVAGAGHADPRAALLAFVGRGMAENTPESWAAAAKEVYGFDSLDTLEQAWIESLRAPPP